MSYKFEPIQCTNEIFQQLTPTEGCLYFVTDTKKIFLGKNGEMVPMTPGQAFFYGVKEIEYDNSGIAPDPNIFFYNTDLENSDRIPAIGDLILNVDGCFYRIKTIAEDGYETIRLTLQGTGTGGGGGTGDGTTSGSFSIQVIDGKDKIYSSTDTKMEITFQGNYNGTDDNYISSVAFQRKNDTEPFYTIDEIKLFNIQHTIDLIDYKHLFGASGTSVIMYVYDKYGVERSITMKIQIIELGLTKTQENLLYTIGNEYKYSCKLIGATSGVTDKKLTYTLYTEDNLNTPIWTRDYNLISSTEDDISYNINLENQLHGIYVLTVQASVKIGGTNKVLTSNILSHKLAKYVTNNKPLLMIDIPEKTEQFTNIPIQYLLLADESNKKYTLDLKLNGKTETELNIYTNVRGVYNLYFERIGTYSFVADVLELGEVSYNSFLNIEEYTGILPVIDTTRADLMLYLNPRGKSNSAVDKDKWVWNEYEGQLSGLRYSTTNGWLMEEDGTSYLKLTSGASLSVNNFRPFEQDPSKNNGITIELDFEIDGVLDYDTELISCIARDKEKKILVGFAVTGDKIKFYSSARSLLSLNLVEKKRTKVSFVIEPSNGTIDFPMVYGYLNGKLSGATFYNKDADSFIDQSGYAAYIKANSTDAQIKIYGIRFYSSALNDKTILNNYTASFGTLEKRQQSYDTNKVYNPNSGLVDLDMLTAETYNLQIPYMLLTGGYATQLEHKWKRKDSNDPTPRLPTGKKDYRMVDVQVVYPKNSYFEGYEDYSFVNEFASGKTMKFAYNEEPSNGGAIMYAQGTSSMEYPVKNLRLRFKKENDWYRVRPDIAKVEIICMKADYMESSGSHNTGAANFIDALYADIGIKTPGQEHFGGEDKETIVTCIKGHPCLIFYSASGEKGTYEYIGKYNLNLDKATPEPFGFAHMDNDDFGYLHTNDEYYEIEYDDDDKYIDTPDGEELKMVQEGEKINSIHCFEFLDNAVEVCNFLGKQQLQAVPDLTEEQFNNNKSRDYFIKIIKDGEESYDYADSEFNPEIIYYYNKPLSYQETWYNTYKNKDNKDVPGWTLGFESRYPEDKVGYHDADSLWPLASWLNELHILRKTNEKKALARFKNEYQCYLNREFTLTYYLITEALLMADSRVKNMMIATWGKENYGENNQGIGTNKTYSYYPLALNEQGEWIPDKTQELIYKNNYIFYPIFYDMDTMLGLDNTGVYRFNYYDEDTDSSIYNGEEVLWNFVRDALKDDLKEYYTTLELARLKADKILPFFNSNQADMANEAFYNGDAQYKYIKPAREGYKDDLNDKEIAPGKGPYLYAAQGDRSLMREWFLTNRIKFLRGKYNSHGFQNGDRIEFRWYFPNGSGQEFIGHENSVQVVKPTGDFAFKSVQTGYAGVMVGANASGVHAQRFDGEDEKTIIIPGASAANGTEAYILGLGILSDLGDLSNKYMQKFIIASPEVRLKTLTLGNPHRDYYNPYWSSSVEGSSSEIGINNAVYLENFNLQNCITYRNVLDFSKCAAIKKILLTGSGVTGVTLPPSGVLTELRLPISVQKIKIDSHPNLTDTNFSIGGYNYDEEDPRIGYGTGTYENDYTSITELNIIDTPIDTYKIVRGARNLQFYNLHGVEWKAEDADEQYCIRTKSEIGDIVPANIYYYYNAETQTYKLYEATNYPEEGALYELVKMLDDDNNIVCIPVLEYLKAKTPAINNATHAEALTGTLEVNIPGTKVDELEIYRKYASIYPNLKITYGSNVEVKGAYRINFYSTRYSEVTEDNVDKLEPYFSILTNSEEGKTINELLALEENGGFTKPTSYQTATHVYTFNNIWHDWQNDKKEYSDEELMNLEPQNSMKLFPSYDEQDRIYTITFYDYDGTTELYAAGRKYQEAVSDFVDTTSNIHFSTKYVYRPDDDVTINTTNRYTFRGWVNEANFNNNIFTSYVDLNKTFVTSDMKLFAHYEIEDAATVVSNLELFEYVNDNIPILTDVTQSNETIQTQVKLVRLKNIYAGIAGGKITLPSQGEFNGKVENIEAIGSFRNNEKITELYCLNNAQYKYIGHQACANMGALVAVHNLPNTILEICAGAFMNNSSLVTIELPDSIKIIQSQVFQHCNQLALQHLPIDLIFIGSDGFNQCKALQVSQLPKKLQYIGDRAFLDASLISIKELPNTLTYIGTQCFMGASNVSVGIFGKSGNALFIGYRGFSGCDRQNQITAIELGRQVSLGTFESTGKDDWIYGQFDGDGYANVTTLSIYPSLYNTITNETDNDSKLLYQLFGRTAAGKLTTINKMAEA